MRLVRLLIALLLFVALVSFARAEDAAPDATPEGAQDAAPLVDEGTESVMIIDTTAAPAEVTETAPIVDEQPVTVVNNGFSFEQVLITLLAFILTIFAGIRMFVVPVLKANVELAKAAGDLVPQQSFDKLVGITESLQRLAEALTPNFKGDDEAFKRIRQEVVDLGEVLHPKPDSGEAVG
jgi:hypothetical protein